MKRTGFSSSLYGTGEEASNGPTFAWFHSSISQGCCTRSISFRARVLLSLISKLESRSFMDILKSAPVLTGKRTRATTTTSARSVGNTPTKRISCRKSFSETRTHRLLAASRQASPSKSALVLPASQQRHKALPATPVPLIRRGIGISNARRNFLSGERALS